MKTAIKGIILLFMAMPVLGKAQTTITLSVDMSNEVVSANGVHVAGSFQGWDPGATMMTDNGDGTYSHTFTTDTAAVYQYKFINGNAWGSEEFIPGACDVDGNRQVEVDGIMGEVASLVCFNSCAACGMTTVKFRVDMTNEDVSPFGVHVAGDFQGWDPGSTELTDSDGDMVYEHLAVLDASIDSIEYKFINGNVWTDPNEFLVGGDCANLNGNRILTFNGETNIVLSANAAGDAYCYDACTSCVLPLNITFTVDMSQVASVSPNGVHLAGAFQGWEPAGTPMSDNGDGTWSVTLEVSPGDQQFKFINSNAWDGGEENMNGQPCGQDGNRLATFVAGDTEYTACFNQCPGVACVPDPSPADLTFQVDASDIELGDSSLYVFGNFTGWQGGAIEMTDNGDGTWEHTQEVSGGVNVDYIYSIGWPTNDGNDESGVFVTLLGDSTNFEDEGCGVPNGFGGYNRRWERSGSDEVIPLHCYNRCSTCVTGLGCTDIHAVNFDPEATDDDESCEYWSPGCDECQPNFDFGDAPFGLSPDPVAGESFSNGSVNFPYIDAWHVLVPATAAGIDSIYPPQLAVDSLIVMPDVIASNGEWEGVVFTDTLTMELFYAEDLGLSFVLNNGGDTPNPNTLLGGNQYCALLSGTPTREGVYRMAIGVEAWMTIAQPFSVPYVFDNFMLTIDNSGEGCTDPFGCNYNVNASVDDGSCLYPGDPCDDCDAGTTTDVLNNSCQCVGGNGFVEGCTDVNACNYDPNAVVDDGSCWFSLGGSPPLLIGTWKLSPEAGAIAIGPEPGSTEWYSAPQGWQNPTSDGANIDFQTDDRWTFTPEGEFIYDNNGSTMNPFQGFIETTMTVEPSTFSLEIGAGLNGNDVFTVDNLNTDVFGEICGWMGVWDSGPAYTIVELTETRLVVHALQQNLDCTNPIASGYFTLIFERVSELYVNCYVEGCTDVGASNFDASANVNDGSCIFFTEDCTTLGQDEWMNYESGAYPTEGVFVMEGTQIEESFVIHLASTFLDSVSGSVLSVMSFEPTTVNGLPTGVLATSTLQIMSPNQQQCIELSGVAYGPGTYSVEVVGELTISLLGAPYSLGEVTFVQSITILPNTGEIFGCTYPHALNFNPVANSDDGSCEFAGCTDVNAPNYEPYASVDDGTCDTGPCITSCLGDLNYDGSIGSLDLLELLTAFGGTCD